MLGELFGPPESHRVIRNSVRTQSEPNCRNWCQLPHDEPSQTVPELPQNVPERSQMTSGETRLGGGSGGLLGELFGTPESHRSTGNDIFRNHRIGCQLPQDKPYFMILSLFFFIFLYFSGLEAILQFSPIQIPHKRPHPYPDPTKKPQNLTVV